MSCNIWDHDFPVLVKGHLRILHMEPKLTQENTMFYRKKKNQGARFSETVTLEHEGHKIHFQRNLKTNQHQIYFEDEKGKGTILVRKTSNRASEILQKLFGKYGFEEI